MLFLIVRWHSFRSDLGGEFVSGELSLFLEDNGKNEFFSARSPESNGRFERVN
jgi:hypothetical protein